MLGCKGVKASRCEREREREEEEEEEEEEKQKNARARERECDHFLCLRLRPICSMPI